MQIPGFAIPLFVILGGVAPTPGVSGAGTLQTQTFTFHRRIIVRVPRMSGDRAAVRGFTRSRPTHWHEKDADDCVEARQFVGAGISSAQSIDLLTRDGDRMRAKLGDSCPALDYYSVVYLRPGRDGRICAKRDAVRSRSGASCEIATFKRLVPDD